MKCRILYSLFLLIASAILFWNASGGPALVQGADRTMSPLSNNTSCGTCHNSGDFSPSLNVQMLDGEAAVSTYEPGKTYTLRVAVTGADAALGFGFQAVVLSGNDNLNAGVFGDPPAGIQVTPLKDRMYAEHSMRSNSNIFTIPWTAPAGGTGDIRIYAGGNATNANGSVTGDQGTFLASPLVLAEFGTSATQDHQLIVEALRIAPNPTQSGVLLTIDNQQPGKYTMTLINAVGQPLENQNLELLPGRQSQWIDLSGYPAGLYFLQLSNGQQLLTRKILKQ